MSIVRRSQHVCLLYAALALALVAVECTVVSRPPPTTATTAMARNKSDDGLNTTKGAGGKGGKSADADAALVTLSVLSRKGADAHSRVSPAADTQARQAPEADRALSAKVRSITSFFTAHAWQQNAKEDAEGSVIGRLRYYFGLLVGPGAGSGNATHTSEKGPLQRSVRVADFGGRAYGYAPPQQAAAYGGAGASDGASAVGESRSQGAAAPGAAAGTIDYYLRGEATDGEGYEAGEGSDGPPSSGAAGEGVEQDLEVERELAQLSAAVAGSKPAGGDRAAPPAAAAAAAAAATAPGARSGGGVAAAPGGVDGGGAAPMVADVPGPLSAGGGGDNVTQLANMVYKVTKEEGVHTLAAAPCRTTVGWMPGVVERLEFEVPGFKFYCVDTDPTGDSGEDAGGPRVDLRAAFRSSASVEIVQMTPAETEKGFPDGVQLVVSWMGMQKWGVRKAWRFIKGLRRRGVSAGLFGNNPESGNGEEEDKRTLNVRKSPMLFNEPLRVISRVGSEGNKPKQLLLYAMDSIRDGF